MKSDTFMALRAFLFASVADLCVFARDRYHGPSSELRPPLAAKVDRARNGRALQATGMQASGLFESVTGKHSSASLRGREFAQHCDAAERDSAVREVTFNAFVGAESESDGRYFKQPTIRACE